MLKTLHEARPIPPLIMCQAHVAVGQLQQRGGKRRRDHDDESHLVPRGVLLAEHQGPDDVADAVGDVDARRRGRALGVPGRVGQLRAEHEDVARDAAADGEAAVEEATPLGQGQEPQQQGGQGRDELAGDADPAPPHGPFHGQVGYPEDLQAGHGAGGHGEQQRLEGAVAEAPDDDGDEGRGGTVDDEGEDSEEECEPELDVGERLPHLLELEVGVADPGVVGPDTGDCDVALPCREATGADRVGGEDEGDEETPYGRDAAGEQEHGLPWGEAPLDLAEAVVDEDGKDDGGTDEGGETTYPHRLFYFLVPTALCGGSVAGHRWKGLDAAGPTLMRTNIGETPLSRNPRKKRWV